MGANSITRGILIGGSFGAMAVAFGLVEHGYFMATGFGAIMGFLAGVTHVLIAKKKAGKTE